MKPIGLSVVVAVGCIVAGGRMDEWSQARAEVPAAEGQAAFAGGPPFDEDAWLRDPIVRKKAAEAGHVEAQVVQAQEDHGRGRLAEARRWYRAAAGQGKRVAQFNAGQMTASGDGGDRDLPEAARWFRAAADQHHSQAMLELGALQRNGLGVPGSPKEAREWLERAARTDQPHAQFLLATMLLGGEGGAADPRAAREWLARSASRCDSAQALLAEFSFQIREGAAVDWAALRAKLATTAPSGEKSGLFRLGFLEMEGLGGPSDVASALSNLEIAARKGHARAAYFLAMLHLGIRRDGLFVDAQARDAKAGKEWLAKAVSQGDPAAIACQAGFEQHGSKESIALLTSAAKKGFAPAQYELGIRARFSKAVPEAEAIVWLEKAAAQGHVGAWELLASFYSEEQGTDHAGKALKLLQKACDAGSGSAMEQLASAQMSGDLGLQPDRKKGFALFLKAVEHDGPNAESNMAEHLKYQQDNDDEIRLAFEVNAKHLADWGSTAADRIQDLFEKQFGLQAASSNSRTSPRLGSTWDSTKRAPSAPKSPRASAC